MHTEFDLNGERMEIDAEARETLADTLRDRAGLTALHLGCEHGSCGACCVLLDGAGVRSCLVLTAMCGGRTVRTLEGLADDPMLRALKDAFHSCHAVQCGFCTPGMLIAGYDIVRRFEVLDEATIRRELAGQICRCTGYVGIVDAILQAHATRARTSETQT